MAQEYLPAPSNIRLADLMKEHNISQPELAKEIGCSKSTISRFISGAKGTLTHEQVLRIARLFNVSTDFLLGETNIPDRKNYDIAELGLSVEAAKNLYTGRINAEVVNLLLENARFAELTYRIAQYFDDTFASGIAAQNAMLTTLSTLLRTKVKTPQPRLQRTSAFGESLCTKATLMTLRCISWQRSRRSKRVSGAITPNRKL